MNRITSRALQAVLDVAVLAGALLLAFELRFDWAPAPTTLRQFVIVAPYIIGAQYAALVLLSVTRFAWRYIGLREVVRFGYALGGSLALLVAVRLAAVPVAARLPLARYAVVSIGVLMIDAMLAFAGTTGLRVGRRLWTESRGRARQRSRSDERPAPRRTLLVGAGQAGVAVARSIEARPDLGMLAVGFIDDDRLKVGTVVHGVPVMGTTEQLAALVARTGAQEILITIANARGKQVRRIVEACEATGLPAKIIPGLHEIVGGQLNLSRLRPVAIEDLLGRDPITLDDPAIAAVIRERVVVVTGAGGSIGSELCRQVAGYGPSKLLLVERAENALFEIHREIIASFPDLEIVPLIADVADVPRIEALFGAYAPEVLFHAAAHKHVPMMEWNAGEAVKNNVVATRRLADLADRFGVGAFVMISTDKAVNPTSVMGACKRAAEIYVQALSQRSKTRFLAVRFGNVLGSTGSVVPIFKQQIANGGPVKVTHADMRRYFMTIPEASQLVLSAATIGTGGEIFILDMGEPVKIVDLAKDLIALSGLRVGEDIEIQFTGVRPGEKLFEELAIEDEAVDKTKHPKIFVGKLGVHDLETTIAHIDGLARAVEAGEGRRVRSLLAAMVPEYHPAIEKADGSERGRPRDSDVGRKSLTLAERAERTSSS
jgi:FlaA1/EpsC-like NDP-sugar epimerase